MSRTLLFHIFLLNILSHECVGSLLAISFSSLGIFGNSRDSPRNTTLLGDFSHTVLLLGFPDNKNRRDGGDRSGTRPCSHEDLDYATDLYSIKHWLHEKL